MQSVSSRIWTRVAVSISYDDNHYTIIIIIIIISLKLYDSEQTNVYYKIEIITLDPKTVCKLCVFDRNTWYVTVHKKKL